jgi:hypothetical protein
MAMKKIVVLIILASLIASCEEETVSLNGKWKLAHYYNVQTGMADRQFLSEGRSIVLTFSDDGRAGTITSDSVRGPVMGIYEIGPRNSFTFTSLGNTFTADEWNTAILNRISQADFVKISRNSLNITCNEGREVLLFVRDN